MKRVSYPDIYTEFLTGGVNAVDKLLSAAETKPSKRTVRLALKFLDDKGVDYDALEDWFRAHHGFGLHNRRFADRKPKSGETRAYKASCQKFGSPYVKVPLATLGIQKGEGVNITFDDDRVVLRAQKQAAPQAAS